VAAFLRYFAARPARGPLKPETAASMTINQTGLAALWGYGWAISRGFGRDSSPRAFGHSGSTGTLAWHDPHKDLTFVLLTTRPAAVSSKTLLAPAADLISQAA
jgi:CubicO group peptidase (beta-lactamase class C family)